MHETRLANLGPLDAFVHVVGRFPPSSNWVRSYAGPIISRLLADGNPDMSRVAKPTLPRLEDSWVSVASSSTCLPQRVLGNTQKTPNRAQSGWYC